MAKGTERMYDAINYLNNALLEYQANPTHSRQYRSSVQEDMYKDAFRAFANTNYELMTSNGNRIKADDILDTIEFRCKESKKNDAIKPIKLFIHSKERPYDVFEFNMVFEKGKCTFSAGEESISPEDYEKNFLPKDIADKKPRPLTRGQSFWNSFRTKLGFGRSDAKKKYDEALSEYNKAVTKSAGKLGILPEEDKLKYQKPEEKTVTVKGLDVKAENKDREMNYLKGLITPDRFGYDFSRQQGAELLTDPKALEDANVPKSADAKLKNDWPAYTSFTKRVLGMAENDPNIRNYFVKLSTNPKTNHLRTLYHAYKTEVFNDRGMDLEKLVNNAVYGDRNKSTSYDLVRVLNVEKVTGYEENKAGGPSFD